MRPGLSRIRRILALLDHPEKDFRSILVTGSNGKGTTCAVLASCLHGFGWNTGLFTSPHLVSVRERFRVNGECASRAAMHEFLRRHGADCRRLGATYFETTRAFALWWFRRREVEWAVLEIGLGGRYDACNAVDPSLSIVTSIALEHTQWLGRTQAQIAAEKGCVARRDAPTLSGSLGKSAERSLYRTVKARGGYTLRLGHDILVSHAQSRARGGSLTLQCFGETLDLDVRIPGRKALDNAALAAAAAMHACRVMHPKRWPAGWKHTLRTGVRRARWPARFEQVQAAPQIVVDVAHNAASVAALVTDWQAFWPKRRPVLLAGMLDDKPARVIGRLFSKIASVAVITRPQSSRAIEPGELVRQWRRHFQRVEAVPGPRAALRRALELAGKHGALLVAGSHYVVGPILAGLGVDPARGSIHSKQ